MAPLRDPATGGRAASPGRTVAYAGIAAALVVAAAACGGTDITAAVPAAPTAASGPAEADTPAPNDTTAAASTMAPVDTSASTSPAATTTVTSAQATNGTLDPVTTDVAVETARPVDAEMTRELAAFAAVHAQLVDDWSMRLAEFGKQAIDLIDDVSRAPAATPVAELSDELVEAIGPDATDPGLVTIRSFAEGASLAIGYAVDGDQDAALSIFLGLQTQADALTAVLDQFDT